MTLVTPVLCGSWRVSAGLTGGAGFWVFWEPSAATEDEAVLTAVDDAEGGEAWLPDDELKMPGMVAARTVATATMTAAMIAAFSAGPNFLRGRDDSPPA
jgi:hypothetical protein